MSVNDGQQYHTNQIHYLRRTLTFSNAAGVYSLGWVPPGAVVLRGGAAITTVFNYGTNNRFDMGFRNAPGKSDDTDEFASDVLLTTAGVIAADDMGTANDNTFPLGGELVVDLDVTGTAGSTGSAVFWLEYMVANT